ncbi:MAG: urea transporter [Bacteroidetes bacterium]|nr:urea transporter [Bacteroidota bacterium]MBS1539355.1 urea transporter [Bacteroidota bacterium]
MTLTRINAFTTAAAHKFPFVYAVLRGLGQIMLQENAATGLLFLIGIFYGSIIAGCAAIVAAGCGTATAWFFRYDKTEIEKGLYGFSAALVGVALMVYFQPVVVVWLFLVIGSVLATVLQHFFIVKKIPVFTFPFVLITWMILFLLPVVYPGVPMSASPSLTVMHNLTFAFRGFGEVIFQNTLSAAFIFFVGVFISSPAAALYGLGGSILAGGVAAVLSAPVEDIMMGLFSYNAVLCAIVFVGEEFENMMWAFISVVLCVVIGFVMYQYQLTQLTFPFVAASCVSLALQKKIVGLYKR